MKLFVSALVCAALAFAQKSTQDWPNLQKYAAADAAAGPPAAGENRVVFMGDSITEGWNESNGGFFPGKPYINRGISGQTTPQMLIRFRPDVVALQPKVVVILAGTNDIAGNTGPETLEEIENNLMSMADIAGANNIRVVFSSVTPVFDFPWKPGLEPAGKVAALNAWMKEYASKHGMVYLDYFSPMAQANGGMKPGLSKDGVHPTKEGYAVMAPLAEKAIAEALQQYVQH